MDYVHPVEVVIPGVQGRVLSVLARTEAELTMRTVAELAGVSGNRATTVLNHLVHLGLVERREVGSAALVRLVRENEAARSVLALADLQGGVTARLRAEAENIQPGPACLVAFGSFVRSEARDDSDIDVLAVPPRGEEGVSNLWASTLGRWCEAATRIAGNPVNLLEASLDELPKLVVSGSPVWRAIVEDGIVLAGVHPAKFKSIG
jgi:hypothetical protein